MNVKVTRVGDELAVVLPADVAQRLNAVEGATLSLTETEGGVRLDVVSTGDGVQPGSSEIVEDIIGRYERTLRILAQ